MARVAMSSKEDDDCFDLFSDDDSDWDANPDYMKTGAVRETWTPPALTMRSRTERRDRQAVVQAYQLPRLSVLATKRSS